MNAFNTAVPQSDNIPSMIEVQGLRQAQQCMALRYCDHHLSGSSEIRMRFREAGFNNLSIDYLEYGADVTVEVNDTENFYFVGIPVAGEVRVNYSEEELVVQPSKAVVLSPSKPFELAFSEAAQWRIVKISRSAVEQQLATLLGRPVTRSVIFDLTMDVDNEQGAGASWLRTISLLEQESGYSQSLYTKGPCLGQIEQVLIAGLLHGQPHNYTHDLHARGTSVAPAHVRRAEKYIQANIHETIAIEDIVEASGVPRRTLYDGFKRFRGISPMRYLRDMRMEGAHQNLLDADGQESVTDIAMQWGFSHLGRFSIEYKKRYGCSPSQTVKLR